MIILFNIDYKVETGEEEPSSQSSGANGAANKKGQTHDVCLNIKRADGTYDTKYMSNNNGHFSFNLRIEQNELERLYSNGYMEYYYSVDSHCTVDVPPSEEWLRRGVEWRTVMHHIDVGQTGMDRYTIYDRWQYRPDDAHLYTPAFTEVLQHREILKPHQEPSSQSSGANGAANKIRIGTPRVPSPSILRLKVRAPQLRSNESLMLVGAHPVLGEWDTRRAIPCHEQQPNEWVACIDTEYTAEEDIEYKFIVVDKENNYVLWETQNNRCVLVPRLRKGEVMEYEVSQAYFEIWNTRKAGTSVSLKDIEEIGGIGITNLKRMVDWIEYTKQKILLIHSVPSKLSSIMEKRLVELHRYATKKGIMIISEEGDGDATITKEGIVLCNDCVLPPQVMTQQKSDGLQYLMIGTKPYLNPDHYPYLSICTIDTHEASALQNWWEENRECTQRFYSEVLGRRDDAPHPLPAWLARDIISRNLHSASIFCIFSLDDWKLINPDTFTMSLKELLKSPRFCDDIAELIKQSGRS